MYFDDVLTCFDMGRFEGAHKKLLLQANQKRLGLAGQGDRFHLPVKSTRV